MNRLLLLTALILTLLLTACFASRYEITTQDGQTYVAQDNPQYIVGTDTYIFTDESGTQVTLEKQEIRFIKEQ